jgi:nitric oxide reductase NorQ protein
VALDFDFPPPATEALIVAHESGSDSATSHGLVALGQRLRALQDRGLAEVPSTRLLIAAARLIAGGIDTRGACYTAIVAPLTDDATLLAAMRDLVDASFP